MVKRIGLEEGQNILAEFGQKKGERVAQRQEQ